MVYLVGIVVSLYTHPLFSFQGKGEGKEKLTSDRKDPLTVPFGTIMMMLLLLFIV